MASELVKISVYVTDDEKKRWNKRASKKLLSESKYARIVLVDHLDNTLPTR